MFSLKKTLSQDIQDEGKDVQVERLFFHDLINHTHGLLLYLGQKQLGRESISVEEVSRVASEVKTLQSLVRDHYRFKHKNLMQTYDWVSFTQVKLSLLQMSQTYLNNAEVSFSFKVEDGASSEDLVYYPAFYRIMNNLVKNIAESGSKKAEFSFILKVSGIFLDTKNQMKKADENELPEYLSRVILSEHSSIISLGLESAHHLAEENGGSFSFEIFDHIWINHLFLPVKKERPESNSDKIPA